MKVFSLFLLTYLGVSHCMGTGNAPLPDVVLDLENLDPLNVCKHENVVDGVTYTCYFPSVGGIFGKVLDGEVTLWEAEGEERCTGVSSRSVGDSVLLTLSVLPPGGRLGLKYCMKRHDGKWENAEKDSFFKKLGGVRGISKPSTLALPSDGTQSKGSRAAPFVLDLSKPDEAKLDVYKHDIDKVVLKDYFPLRDHITSVVESGTSVWRAEADQKCFLAKSYTKEKHILFSVCIKNNNGYVDKYFEKADGVWNEVDREVFSEKVRVLLGISE
ncbi:signal peptide containing protein [Theileria equi strain WA]|uniref:Signal peptide containing protein n=1 Tax=Theileria equi strain WA TaxID=1537102 RepID=L1LAD2_THEEQ|nr:signal peptide containing protein [Theileria equi strain WA]EKX72133.1 signal peptide containing protein [Theileria equi strain WA]|eukprot:XP_004831585.1 signal peptide containing protein [Theileria equi strain WA]